MTAIFRREMRSYVSSLTGPVACCVMLFIVGLMFRYVNLHSGYATFAYAVSNSGLIFYIVVPVLSMRVFAEERRQRTDQLLFTAPVTLWDIVMGKYLALILVFAVPAAVMAFYPLIIAHFGQGPFAIDYAALLAFFLEGCAYLAVGMLVSTLTENVILAAIGSILFVFATQMIHNLYAIFGSSSFAALIFFVALSILLGLLVYVMTRYYYAAIAVTAVCAVACFVLFLVNDSWYAGKISLILGALDFHTHMQDFYQGSLKIANYTYFVSVAVGGVALTMLSLRRQRVRTLGGGAYALTATALIIAGAVLVNLIGTALPAKYTVFDVSTMKLFSIGEETQAVLDGLTEEVTLYFVYKSDDKDEAVDKLLDTYASSSDKIRVEKIDLVASPAYGDQFGIGEVTPGSVVAVCGDRKKVADHDDMYTYTYGSSYYAYASGFDAEGRITAAIDYVTSTSHPVMYYTTGHGELEMTTAMTGAFSKANIELLPLNLLNTDIPEDCDALICFTPSEDFTEEEAKKVIRYLGEGGDALLSTILTAETPVFDKIMAAYRVTRMGGLVVEEDPGAYTQLGYLLMPQVNGTSAVTEGVADLNLVYSFAEGLWVEEPETDSWTVTTLLQSTASSFSASADSPALKKQDTDPLGPFPLAVLVEHSLSASSYGTSDVGDQEETEVDRDRSMTKLLYFTTPCVFSEDALSDVLQSELALPAGNDRLFANAIAYLSDETSMLSVPVKSLEEPMISLTSAQVLTIGNLLMLALPGAVMAAGVFIYVRRRLR